MWSPSINTGSARMDRKYTARFRRAHSGRRHCRTRRRHVRLTPCSCTGHCTVRFRPGRYGRCLGNNPRLQGRYARRNRSCPGRNSYQYRRDRRNRTAPHCRRLPCTSRCCTAVLPGRHSRSSRSCRDPAGGGHRPRRSRSLPSLSCSNPGRSRS